MYTIQFKQNVVVYVKSHLEYKCGILRENLPVLWGKNIQISDFKYVSYWGRILADMSPLFMYTYKNSALWEACP